MEHGGYQIGELAKRLNVSQRTVRYYEQLGLITAERKQSGYRLFSETQLEKMRTIISLKEIGMPLEEIRRLLLLRHQGSTGSETAPRLLEYLNDKLADLKRTVNRYNGLIKELKEVIRIVEKCKACNNLTGESVCERCVDARNDHRVPPLMRTLL